MNKEQIPVHERMLNEVMSLELLAKEEIKGLMHEEVDSNLEQVILSTRSSTTSGFSPKVKSLSLAIKSLQEAEKHFSKYHETMIENMRKI